MAWWCVIFTAVMKLNFEAIKMREQKKELEEMRWAGRERPKEKCNM